MGGSLAMGGSLVDRSRVRTCFRGQSRAAQSIEKGEKILERGQRLQHKDASDRADLRVGNQNIDTNKIKSPGARRGGETLRKRRQ